ncbi:MAG: hypothetical protein IKQ87_00015 [Clostridia bacterium]|nr:hypothetical protein [Clostridia bacterium]
MKREAANTHFFKEAVVLDGAVYQHVVGLNELWDWRLILDLSGDPAWQLVTVNRPPVCRFPGERRKLLARRARIKCPACRARLFACEERYPDGEMDVFLLPPRPSSFELWHDDACRCPECGVRVGLAYRKPALPAGKSGARARLWGIQGRRGIG